MKGSRVKNEMSRAITHIFWDDKSLKDAVDNAFFTLKMFLTNTPPEHVALSINVDPRDKSHHARFVSDSAKKLVVEPDQLFALKNQAISSSGLVSAVSGDEFPSVFS